MFYVRTVISKTLEYPVAGGAEDAAKKHAEHLHSRGLKATGLFEVTHVLPGKPPERTFVEVTSVVDFICEEVDGL